MTTVEYFTYYDLEKGNLIGADGQAYYLRSRWMDLLMIICTVRKFATLIMVLSNDIEDIYLSQKNFNNIGI